MKQDDNLKNLASLNEELKRKRFSISKKNLIVPMEKYNLRAKKAIYQSFIKNYALTKKVDPIKNEVPFKVVQFISTKVQDFEKLNDKSKLTDFHLNNDYSLNDYNGLKEDLRSYGAIKQNKSLLQKELVSKNLELARIKTKLEFVRKGKMRYRRLLRKKAQLELRIKDIKGFIESESVSRKLYLSDEPPLTAAGWVKLFMSYMIIIFWALIILWPIGELVRATLNNATTTYLNTNNFEFGFDSFSRLFNETEYLSWLVNTIIIAVVTSVLTVILTLLMGYAFSRFKFRGKKASLLTVLLLQMIPSLSALTVFYVLYQLLNTTLAIDGRIALVIIYVGGGIAGNTFIMKGYMDSISTEIDEAAKIDGLSQFRIFVRIIAPLTRPMIAIVALQSFIGPFGDVILPSLLLSDPSDYTLARGLQVLISNPRNPDQPAFAAGAVITAIPVSIVFISLRKYLIGGITAGGVKG